MLHVVTGAFRALISWAYLAVVAFAFGLLCLVFLPSRRRRIALGGLFGHVAGRGMLFLAGAAVPPGVQARLKSTHPAIYVSNHTSYLDVGLCAWAAPIPTVGTAKKEAVWFPFIGPLYVLSGHVLIDRARHREAASAVRQVIDLVRRHRLGVWFWPEGTRSPDGRLRPFKRGFAHVALATHLPIVPVVVSHAHRCWPKGRFLTSPARIGVQVLDPIPTTGWTLKDIDQHVADVHARFVAALPADQRPGGQKV